MLRRALRRSLSLSALSLVALTFIGLAAQAQNPANLVSRAANLARMKAESLNGGLGVYHTAPCMHERGGGSCLVANTAKGFTFRFLGGQPGWHQKHLPPSVETEILVAPDATTIERVIYNRLLR